MTHAASFSGTVIKVLDGDTIDVLHNHKPERIRLNGIDAPEKGQAYGQRAKAFVLGLTARQMVTVNVMDTDRYGRIVGDVILPDGRNLNREIVKSGYAWWYRKYSSDSSLGILEAEARRTGRGLWQEASPQPPWDWRAVRRSGAMSAKPNTSAVASGGLHGNVKSKVFHQPACENYRGKNCTAGFKRRDDALAAGFRPCKKCNP